LPFCGLTKLHTHRLMLNPVCSSKVSVLEHHVSYGIFVSTLLLRLPSSISLQLRSRIQNLTAVDYVCPPCLLQYKLPVKRLLVYFGPSK
jgi:hypothetical protein